MRIPHATGRGAGRSLQLSAERLVNLYAEQAPQGAKSPVVVHGCPGLTRFAEVSDERPRGLYRTPRDGQLYLVAAQTLYHIDSDGNETSLGTIAGAGRVGMADNGTQLCIVTGSKGYIYDTENGLQEIADKAFPGASTVTYIDGFFVFNNPGSGQAREQFFISSLRDGTVYDALDFASAESYPDDLKRVFADHSELLLFGTDTIEIWFNAGAADFPFRRAQGSVIEQGLGAAWSVAKCDETVFWLDNEGSVRRLQGSTPVRVSTHSVENAITKGDWENASAWSYVEEGHAFYVLTVPARTLAQTAGTYVFDAATGLWHERKSHERDYCRSGFYAKAYGKHLTCDHDSARLYTQSLDTYSEDGEHLIAEMTFPPVQADGGRFIVDELQLDLEVGVGGRAIDPLPAVVKPFAGVFDVGTNLLRAFEFDGSDWSQLGNGKYIAEDRTDLAMLSERRAAVVSGRDDDTLTTYDFDGSDWVQVGDSIALNATYAYAYVVALDANTVAVVQRSTQCLLRAYRFDGDSWSPVGSGLIIPTDQLSHCALSSSMIAAYSPSSDLLQAYAFDGSSWSAVGNTYNIPNLADFDLTALSDSRIAFAREDASEILVLDFDGSDWSLSSTTSYSVGIIPRISGITATRLALADAGTGNAIELLEYDGSSWSRVGNRNGLGFGSTGVMDAYNQDFLLQIDRANPPPVAAPDPQVMLRESRDGRTWGMSEDWRSMGKQGEYGTRVLWRRRGQYRTYIPRISISAPVKRAIFAAYAKIRSAR